jgi:lauroyl/myristoyl acyltransferase
VMIPSLLNQHGVPTALAVDKEAWPLSALRQWRLDLAKAGDVPTAVPADARQMLRFLKPGRCLMVALDFPTAEHVEVAFGGGAMRLSTPPLRLARVARAAVVPMLAVHEGQWRIRLHLGAPVPDELLRAGDYQAAAAHIANELLPVAAAAPGQALPTMVEAFIALPQPREAASAVAPSSA